MLRSSTDASLPTTMTTTTPAPYQECFSAASRCQIVGKDARRKPSHGTGLKDGHLRLNITTYSDTSLQGFPFSFLTLLSIGTSLLLSDFFFFWLHSPTRLSPTIVQVQKSSFLSALDCDFFFFLARRLIPPKATFCPRALHHQKAVRDSCPYLEGVRSDWPRS